MIKIILPFVILLGISLFLYWSNKNIVTTSYEYQDKDVPKAFDGFRITQVSDLQSEYFGKNQKNLIGKVSATKADIIVITGDLVDRNHTNYDASLSAITQLIKIAPVYYTNGNHEMALPDSEMSELYQEMRNLGVRVIFDTFDTIRREKSAIVMMGLSENTIYTSKEMGGYEGKEYDEAIIVSKIREMTDSVNEDDFVIMLTHEPQFLRAYASKNVDLIFAGHAHGGQIRLPFTQGLFAPGQGVLPKLTNGVHRREDSTMIISRGLGNSVFPFRIFNRPEITVTTLIRENEKEAK